MALAEPPHGHHQRRHQAPTRPATIKLSATVVEFRHKHVMTFLGIPNHNYALDLSTNLLPPINWMPQVTNPANLDGTLLFTNLGTLPQGFYRTRYVP